jgi:pimeloyl-ACP methyl ester carboxylesterase
VSAPHIFVESITLEGIRKADATGREKIISMLERYHNDPKSLYLAWRDTWLLPEFRNWNIEEYVSKIKCPVLAIQGKQDEYGTPRQVERIGELVSASKIVLLDNCRHATYKDCEPEVMDEVLLFSRSIS